MHARGIVHRDIKPSNILIVEYGADTFRARARLTDFGIALDPWSTSEVKEGVTTGTAAYLSPEQVLRDLIGPATDIYSLGLVLLECFTRSLTFPGEPVEAAVARVKLDPAIPAELGGGLDPPDPGDDPARPGSAPAGPGGPGPVARTRDLRERGDAVRAAPCSPTSRSG